MVTLGRHVEFHKVTLAALAGTAAAIKLTVNNILRGADRHFLRAKTCSFTAAIASTVVSETVMTDGVRSAWSALPLSHIHYARNTRQLFKILRRSKKVPQTYITLARDAAKMIRTGRGMAPARH